MKKIKKITIIGLGLMGGSLALAIKNKGLDYLITGYDLNKEFLKEALATKAIDRVEESLKASVKDAQLVIIATPLKSYESIFKEISDVLKTNTIITDLGSVKHPIVELAKNGLPDRSIFIGGHPMTGSERAGFIGADPFLYENAYYFLTPSEETPKPAVKIVEELVKNLGAYPVFLSPKEHDLIVSRISHLPHIIAMNLVNFIDEQDQGISHLPFVGGGFRDTTRIAAGNPQMWRDILFANQEKTIKSIDAFQILLEKFKSYLAENQKEKVLKALENAKAIRDSIPRKGRDYLTPLFEIFISVEDKPGAIAELTQLISTKGINIREIEILHSRQREGGALRLAFASEEDRQKVIEILKQEKDFFLSLHLGEKDFY